MRPRSAVRTAVAKVILTGATEIHPDAGHPQEQGWDVGKPARNHRNAMTVIPEGKLGSLISTQEPAGPECL